MTSDKSQKSSVAECNDQIFSQHQFESSVDTSFFYTSDKTLNSFDDSDIILKIQEKYPNFNQSCKDTQLKKTLLAILNDNEFIDYILSYFQLSILELISIIYKQYASLFNQLFIKKVKAVLQTKKYDIRKR